MIKHFVHLAVWFMVFTNPWLPAHPSNTVRHSSPGRLHTPTGCTDCKLSQASCSTTVDFCPKELYSCVHITGTECSWYQDCLERNQPCTGTEHGYAIEFGLKFCRLFEQYHSQFSLVGQEWVEGVTKCLQFALIPFLETFTSNATMCAAIKREAFSSHSRCYLDPGPNVPSVCDISVTDWAVGSYLVANNLDSLVYYEIISQSYELMTGCGVQCVVHVCVSVVVLLVSLLHIIIVYHCTQSNYYVVFVSLRTQPKRNFNPRKS